MSREGRFHAEYLGWKETRGLYGFAFTEPIVAKLLLRQSSAPDSYRITMKIKRGELHIVQSKSSARQKVKYPAVPLMDISFVTQSPSPNADVVSCIFLGYNSRTHCAAHAHVYRFDSADSAAGFVRMVNSAISRPEYRQRVIGMEHDLAELGHVVPSRLSVEVEGVMRTRGSDGGSYGSPSPNSSDGERLPMYPSAEEALRQRKDIVITKTAPKPELKGAKLFGNIQEELEHKLAKTTEAPILLPPKDYDTIVRRYGHLSIRDRVKPRSIIGNQGVFQTDTATSTPNKEWRSTAIVTPQVRNPVSVPKELGLDIKRQPSQTSCDSGVPASDDTSDTSNDLLEQSMYGLYRGLKAGSNSSSGSPVDMAMWSPEFSFDNDSGVGSARQKTSTRAKKVASFHETRLGMDLEPKQSPSVLRRTALLRNTSETQQAPSRPKIITL